MNEKRRLQFGLRAIFLAVTISAVVMCGVVTFPTAVFFAAFALLLACLWVAASVLLAYLALFLTTGQPKAAFWVARMLAWMALVACAIAMKA